LPGAHDAQVPLQEILALGEEVGRSEDFQAGKTKGPAEAGPW
jgi:hypothetical protein